MNRSSAGAHLAEVLRAAAARVLRPTWRHVVVVGAVVIVALVFARRSTPIALATAAVALVVVIAVAFAVVVVSEIVRRPAVFDRVFGRLDHVWFQRSYRHRTPAAGRGEARALAGYTRSGLGALDELARSSSRRHRRDATAALADYRLLIGEPAAAGALVEPAARRSGRWSGRWSTGRGERRTLAGDLAAELGTDDALDGWRRWATALRTAGFAPVSLRRDPATDPLFAVLAHLDVAAAPIFDGDLISVIVALVADDAPGVAERVEVTVPSLLAQTWQRLEIVVVHDGVDHEVLRALAGRAVQYPQIVVVDEALPTRRLVAAALARCRGALVSVASGWVHPERLAAQSRLLAGDPAASPVAGVIVATAAVGPNGHLVRAGDAPGEQLAPDRATLMVRRGDGSALATALLTNDDLASAVAPRRLHVIGAPLGVRVERRSALDRHVLAAPVLLRHRSASPLEVFDVVMISDFALPGGTTASNLAEIAANERAGLRTGLVHHRARHLRAAPINPKVRAALSASTRLLDLSDRVAADAVIVKYPPAVVELPEVFVAIDTAAVVVAVNQTPFTGYAGEDRREVYRIAEVDAELRRVLGVAPRWAPIGPAVRAVLTGEHGAEMAEVDLAAFDWYEIIDVDDWARPDRAERPAEVPFRIGRHGRDSVWKWPADAAALRAAYPESDDIVVDILGGADVPRRLLGSLPRNWQVRAFDSISPVDYLAQLDVVVNFVHPEMVEAFGRTNLEALAAGVPVITDRRFAELFGDGARYATPAETAAIIDELRDRGVYGDQVRRGRAVVEERFGHDAHLRRLAALGVSGAAR